MRQALFTSNSLLLALAVAGCGGGGDGRLGKAEFIQRGDAICRKYRAKNQELNKRAPARNPTDPRATDEQVKKSGPVLEKLSDNVRAAREEFDDLEPPANVERDWDITLEDLDRIADELHQAAVAAVRLDRQRVVDLYSDILRLNRRVTSFEQEYGFRVCGSSG